MIKFSKKEDYAFILLNYLSKNRKQIVSLSDISRKYNISPNFLRNIAVKLKNKGIIESKEGKTGGYMLKKDPEKIKIGEIISIFSKMDFLDCVNCPKEENCETQFAWKRVNKEFLDKIYELSFAEFIGSK